MALIESQGFDYSTPPVAASGGLSPLTRQALDRLAEIHAERLKLHQAGELIARGAHAAGALTLCAMAVLAFGAGTSLQPCFTWAMLVLLGIAALLRTQLRAHRLEAEPMAEAAGDLTLILLYCGFAWGAGAAMVLSPETRPAAALLFAAFPSLVLSLLLKERNAVLAFLAPATGMIITVAILRPWPDAGLTTALLLLAQSLVAVGSQRLLARN
jgi:hypothetical protein